MSDPDEMSPEEYAQFLVDRKLAQAQERQAVEDAVKAIRGLPSKTGDLKD